MYFDLVDMPEFIEDKSFDIIIMQHVLGNIKNYKAGIGNISKALDKKGVAFLEIPNHKHLLEHEVIEQNHYGNVWNFSRNKLLCDIGEFFNSVKILDYEEGPAAGTFFICE